MGVSKPGCESHSVSVTVGEFSVPRARHPVSKMKVWDWTIFAGSFWFDEARV
jgi:hypothetical protein